MISQRALFRAVPVRGGPSGTAAVVINHRQVERAYLRHNPFIAAFIW
jgi:hypothetical protein